MWAFISLLIMLGYVHCDTNTRFTNIKCIVLDPSYCAYKECQLKVLGRGIVGLNVHAILLKGPFNNAKVNISLFRKYDGFRPFMFNVTVDFCKFMAAESSVMSFPKVVANFLVNNSNINHPCPYEKEIRVRNLVMKEEQFRFLPLPSGEYQVQIMAATDGQWKTKIKANFIRQEDIMKS